MSIFDSAVTITENMYFILNEPKPFHPTSNLKEPHYKIYDLSFLKLHTDMKYIERLLTKACKMIYNSWLIFHCHQSVVLNWNHCHNKKMKLGKRDSLSYISQELLNQNEKNLKSIQ